MNAIFNRPFGQERAILVGFGRVSVTVEQMTESLDELSRLLESAGGIEVGRVTQRGRPHAAHLVGTGKLEEIESLAIEQNANLIVFDDELSPAQMRNLDARLNRHVIDRPTLILSIFARHAHTKEARTQVELAQYQYLYPRLTGQWTHMTRHEGGIGTRGPGETQLETDRRLVGRRIQKLKKQLESIDSEREVQRRGREDLFRVVLVGYTNAGKSTLFNRLTRAKVWAEDRLFCTLDPTTRILAYGGRRRVLLTDTIGFIRKLPALLFAAFRATLNEVAAADLILIVVDYSDPYYEHALDEVETSLREIKAEQVPRIYVLNKIDRLNGGPVAPFSHERPSGDVVAISAATGTGVERLIDVIVGAADRRPDMPVRPRSRTARARVRWDNSAPQ
jgi:GTP-binding protein HflX